MWIFIIYSWKICWFKKTLIWHNEYTVKCINNKLTLSCVPEYVFIRVSCIPVYFLASPRTREMSLGATKNAIVHAFCNQLIVGLNPYGLFVEVLAVWWSILTVEWWNTITKLSVGKSLHEWNRLSAQHFLLI